MNKMNHVNDLDHLYDQPAIKHTDKIAWDCPVCGKTYNTGAGIHKHMKKRDCADVKLKFKGTVTEKVGHEIFGHTIGDFTNTRTTTLIAFRKHNSYKGVLRFVLFCMDNKIDPSMYYEWILQYREPKYYNQLLKMAVTDSTLKDYMLFRVRNEEIIDSERFFERNQEKLKADIVFLMRSLERGDIAIGYALKNDELRLEERLQTSGQVMKQRMIILLDMAGNKDY